MYGWQATKRKHEQTVKLAERNYYSLSRRILENPRCYAYAVSYLISLQLAFFMTKIWIKHGLHALSTFFEQNYAVTNVRAMQL
jgi:hypothetical protein